MEAKELENKVKVYLYLALYLYQLGMNLGSVCSAHVWEGVTIYTRPVRGAIWDWNMKRRKILLVHDIDEPAQWQRNIIDDKNWRAICSQCKFTNDFSFLPFLKQMSRANLIFLSSKTEMPIHQFLNDLDGIYLCMQLNDWLLIEVALLLMVWPTSLLSKIGLDRLGRINRLLDFELWLFLCHFKWEKKGR